MAIENAPYIAGLTTSIPSNNSPRAEGAAQIRGTKTAVKNSFPNVDAPVTATASRMNEVFDNPSQVPLGAVLMWFQPDNPEGWETCDGEIYNGIQTPDLRGLFIQGESATQAIGTTGGNDAPTVSDSLVVEGHGLTSAELAPHTHEYTDRYYPEDKSYLEDRDATNVMVNDSPNKWGSGDTDNGNDGMMFVTDTTESTGQGAAHTHPIADNTDNPFDNRPAFYTLRYICYVGV